jgi:hypothetical protein
MLNRYGWLRFLRFGGLDRSALNLCHVLLAGGRVDLSRLAAQLKVLPNGASGVRSRVVDLRIRACLMYDKPKRDARSVFWNRLHQHRCGAGRFCH